MEKIGDDGEQPEENLKYQEAIRCAKAAILLSSLRSSFDDSSADNTSQIQVEERLALMEMEKQKLEILIWKLVKENRKLGHWVRVSLIMCFLFVLFVILILACNCL